MRQLAQHLAVLQLRLGNTSGTVLIGEHGTPAASSEAASSARERLANSARSSGSSNG